MERQILNQSIDIIKIPIAIINLLKENDIITLNDLCNKTKTDLKKIRLSFEEINKIQIELQLLGLNLKKGL